MARTAPLPRLGADKRLKSEDEKIGVSKIASATGPTRIEQLFSEKIPADLTGEDRAKFVKGLAIGVFAMQLDGDGLAERIKKSRIEIAKQRGADDPKIDRLAALRFAREIRSEAVENGRSLSGFENADAAKKYDAAVRYAKSEMGWSVTDIRAATVDLIVSFDGDKEKAAEAFYDLVRSEKRIESGHMIKTEIDASTENGKPHNIKEISVAPEVDQIEERNARLEREKKWDARLDSADKTAAAVLTDKEYAAYRLIRDNAHLIHFSRAEMTLNGDEKDNTPGKLIADRLNVSMRMGRMYAETVFEKIKTKQGIYNSDLQLDAVGPKITGKETVAEYVEKLGVFNANVQTRLTSTTGQIVEKARNTRSTERTEESRERERAQTRERAARLHAAKKAQRAAEIGL